MFSQMNELVVRCGDDTRHNGCVPGRFIGGRWSSFIPQFTAPFVDEPVWRTGHKKSDPPAIDSWASRISHFSDGYDYYLSEKRFGEIYRRALLKVVRKNPQLFEAGKKYTETDVLSIAGEEVFEVFAESFKAFINQDKAKLVEVRFIFDRFVTPLQAAS